MAEQKQMKQNTLFPAFHLHACLVYHRHCVGMHDRYKMITFFLSLFFTTNAATEKKIHKRNNHNLNVTTIIRSP
jgi:hypothetical protein